MIKVATGRNLATSDKWAEKWYEKGTHFDVKNGFLHIYDEDNVTIATFSEFIWVEVCDQ